MNLSFARPRWSACRRWERAFSLPETAIAVAIAALGIVSIMGLMPQGIETAHKTNNMNAETRIMSEIVGELETEDWSLVSAGSNIPNRTYDDQGMLISNGSGNGGSTGITGMVTYVAQIQVSNTLLPGSSASGGSAGNTEPYLRRLTINIANTPNSNYSFPPSDVGRFKSATFFLTKLQ